MPNPKDNPKWKGCYRNFLTYSPKYVDKKDLFAYGKPKQFSELLAAYGTKRMTGSFQHKHSDDGEKELWMHVVFEDFYNAYFWGPHETLACEKFYYTDMQTVEATELMNRLTSCDLCQKSVTTTWTRMMLPKVYFQRLDLTGLKIFPLRLCFDDCINRISIFHLILTLKLSEWCGIPFFVNEIQNNKPGEELREILQCAKSTAAILLKENAVKSKLIKNGCCLKNTNNHFQIMNTKELDDLQNVTGPLSTDICEVPKITEIFLNCVKKMPLVDFSIYDNAKDVNEAHFCAVNRKLADSKNEFIEIYESNFFLVKQALIEHLGRKELSEV